MKRIRTYYTVAAATAFLLANGAPRSSSAFAQAAGNAQPGSSDAIPLTEERAKMLQAMGPVCRDRDADIKAHRKPKRFNAFLLDLPPAIREDVKLMCDSM